jgi:sensor histidine kinase YesM
MGWGPAVAGHLGLALVVMFAATWAHNGIHYGLYALWPDEHSLQYTTLSAWTLLTEFRFLGDLLPYALLLLVGFGRYNYLRSEARRARAKQLQAELTAARLASLRMQINPHFLYNTLHTISTMAGRNPDGIRQASARLSDLMRYALSTSDQQEVPLTDELDVLQSYLDIQKLRLEERLEVTLDVNPETRPALVPTLLLQPLAENAVKHGFEGRDCTGHLVVRARRDEDRLVLVVADDGRGLSGSSHLASGNGAAHDGEHQAASRSNGTGADPGAGPSRDMGHDQHDQGTGLQNITRRLNGLYGDAAELDLESPAGGGLRVVIQLPFHVRTADADLRADGVVAS